MLLPCPESAASTIDMKGKRPPNIQSSNRFKKDPAAFKWISASITMILNAILFMELNIAALSEKLLAVLAPNHLGSNFFDWFSIRANYSIII